MAKGTSNERGAVTYYQLSDGQSPSEGIVSAISAVSGLSPAVPTAGDGKSALVMDPLGSVVDTDALDRLVDTADASGRISFTYLGHSVTVDGTGQVTVTPGEATGDPGDRVPAPVPPYRSDQTNQ